jgi:membrane protein DedA with SNARE-associated domain
MISSLVDWLVSSIGSLGYVGIFIAVVLESFIAPIPSQVILPFSGFLASQGTLNIVLVILVVAFSAYLGTLPFYVIGLWGEEFIMKFLKKYGKYLFISEEDLDKGYVAFKKYGYGIVFFGRFLPIIRSVISFPAGAAKMKFWKFSIFTFAGTLMFATVMCLAGYFMGESWEVVVEYIEEYERLVIILFAILLLLYIWRGMRKVIKESKEREKVKQI